MTVQFGELPASSTLGKHRVYESLVSELRERPGEWALIRTVSSRGGAQSVASNLQRGKTAGVPAGVVEATSRGADVWARYIGD